jgi:hypothetical protein
VCDISGPDFACYDLCSASLTCTQSKKKDGGPNQGLRGRKKSAVMICAARSLSSTAQNLGRVMLATRLRLL